MKQSDWISVKDRLPKIGEEVLVCREQKGEQWCDIAMSIKGYTIERVWFRLNGSPIDDVTHWQPIVFPKKEKK